MCRQLLVFLSYLEFQRSVDVKRCLVAESVRDLLSLDLQLGSQVFLFAECNQTLDLLALVSSVGRALQVACGSACLLVRPLCFSLRGFRLTDGDLL